jgi:hypothetical protein
MMNVTLNDGAVRVNTDKIKIEFQEPLKKFLNVKVRDGVVEITSSDDTLTGGYYNLDVSQEGKHDWSLPLEEKRR